MGLEIDIAWLTVLLFGSLGILLGLGLPMAFCTGSLAVIFLFVFGNGAILNMMPSRIFPFMADFQLSAVPRVILMAAVRGKAGLPRRRCSHAPRSRRWPALSALPK